MHDLAVALEKHAIEVGSAIFSDPNRFQIQVLLTSPDSYARVSFSFRKGKAFRDFQVSESHIPDLTDILNQILPRED